MYCIDSARSSKCIVALVAVAVIMNVDREALAQIKPSSSSQISEEILPANQLQATASYVPTAPPEPTASVDPNGARKTDGTLSSASLQLGYNVLMQGPVHEAFAVPTNTDPMAGSRMYAETPPKPIDEKPPENVLAGDGAIWISGYWAWSDDANKYVWVSGLYRKVPPGRKWTPGYWSETASGYRWTSGYWSGEQVSSDNSVESLPAPPTSIDNGPSVPSPGENYFWLPGQWEYANEQYQWRSGYWTAHYEGWVWQPACYLSTPEGFLYVDGYWDALPPQRGQLYAPVDFYGSVIQQPGYVYRPQYPLAITYDILLHLFTRPDRAHYYYGDFYGTSYAAMGYRPWYDTGYGFGSPLGFSHPWLGYYDWNYRRSGIDFVGSMQRYNDFYRANPQQRPPKWLKDNRHIKSDLTFANASLFAKSNGSHRSLDEIVLSQVGGKSAKRSNEKWGDIPDRSSSEIVNVPGLANRPLNHSQPKAHPHFDASSSKTKSSKADSGSTKSKAHGNSGAKPSDRGFKPSGGKGKGKGK